MKLLQNTFFRKVLGALISTVIGVILLIPVVMNAVIPEGYSLVYTMFEISGGYMFGWGLPVSLLAHFATLPLSGWIRWLISILIYIGGAWIFIWIKTGVLFLVMGQLIYVTLFSTVYWLIDEWLQLKARKSDTNFAHLTNQ